MASSFGFTWDGPNATLLDALREEGWDVTPGVNSLTFTATWRDGTYARMHGGFRGIDPAGRVNVYVEGLQGVTTDEEARATLGPLMEALAARFGGESPPEYRGGARICDGP